MTKHTSRTPESEVTTRESSAPRRRSKTRELATSASTLNEARELDGLRTLDDSALWRENEGSDPAERMPRAVVRHIQRIAARVRELGAKTAALHGIHVTDMYVLTVLLRSAPDFSAMATDLKNLLLYTSGGMTKRLDRLEEQRLVERLPHPSDRRAWIIRLTPTGKAVAESIVANGRRNGVMMGIATAFDETEWTLLTNLLARLDAALEASTLDSSA